MINMPKYNLVYLSILLISLASAINGVNIGSNEINGVDISPEVSIAFSGNGSTTNNYYNITYNITDYCYANGTNRSGADCFYTFPYILNKTGLFGFDSVVGTIDLIGYTEIVEQMRVGDSSVDDLRLLGQDVQVGANGEIQISGGEVYVNGQTVCLNDGTNCMSVGMDYTNVGLTNKSNTFTGNTTTLQNMYTGIGTNQSIRISASSSPDYTGLYQNIGSLNGKNLYSSGRGYIWYSSGFWFVSPRPNWQEYDFYLFSSADTPPLSAGWSPQLGASGTVQTLIGEKNATFQTSTDGSIIIRNNTVVGGSLIVNGKDVNVINGRTIFNCNNTAVPNGNYKFCAGDGTTILGEFISTSATNNYWQIGGVTTLQTIGGLAAFGSNAPEGAQVGGNNLPAATGKAPEFGIGWLVESIGLGNITQVIRGEIGQIADNLQIQNSGGTPLVRIDKDGNYFGNFSNITAKYLYGQNLCYSNGTNCVGGASSTYNATYDGYNTSYGYTWKNWTGEANSTIYSQYGKWFYNMSTGGSATPNDGITIKYQNVTNFPSCSAGQVLTNSTGSLSCVTPTATVVRNVYRVDITTPTINTTLASSGKQLMIIPISANINYTLDCNLYVSSNITTTGVQLNISFPGFTNWTSIKIDHPTTVTAWAFSRCLGSLKNCFDASATSIGVINTPLPVTISGAIYNGATAGNINVSFKSEVANSPAFVHKGGYCEVTSF